MTHHKNESRRRTWGSTTTASRDNRTRPLIFSFQPKKRKLTAMQKALAAIARRPNDRPREVRLYVGCALLLSDSGGDDILDFDDATALHHLLMWLRNERKLRAEKMKAMFEVNKRRSAIKLVEVGK